MSRIEHLDILSDKYKDSGFKESEIRQFEEKFGARIVKDDYISEKELENDWNSYLSLPYGLKVLANERCLRLYGKKNEEQYMEQRKKFLMQDIPMAGHDVYYRPSGFTESEFYKFDNEEDKISFLNKLARDYMDNGGHNLLMINAYDSLAELNRAYYDFNNQCDDHKNIANNKSLELYGYRVPEIYNQEVHKFLLQDIKDSEYDQRLRPIIVDSISASEAVYEAFMHSKDFMERAILTETALKAASTPVENSIAEDMHDRLLREMDNEDYLGEYNFLLPWEIMKVQDINLLESNPLFVNYYARALGLKPVIKDFREQVRIRLSESTDNNELISLGWNPCMAYTEANRRIASKRANDIIKEHCHYQFIDLSNTPNMLNEEDQKDINDNNQYGLSILIIKEMGYSDIGPGYKNTVLITLDENDKEWNSIDGGYITSKVDVESIIRSYTLPLITLFFIKFDKITWMRLKSTSFDEFNKNNEFQTVCKMLQTADLPNIANKKLFIMNLINMICYNNTFAMAIRFNNHLDDSKDIIHILYDQLGGSYNDLKNSYSKLIIYDNLEDLEEATVFSNCNFTALTESEVHMRPMVCDKDEWDNWEGFVDLFKEMHIVKFD